MGGKADNYSRKGVRAQGDNGVKIYEGTTHKAGWTVKEPPKGGLGGWKGDLKSKISISHCESSVALTVTKNGRTA